MGKDNRNTGSTSRRGIYATSYSRSTQRQNEGNGEVSVKHYRKLGTPTVDETFDAELEKKINAWVEQT